ncbi:hypothetical protein KAW65_04575 [candidate division WOR-3 bacterium]|nr:hypothetical protein [candidate division WOR-3 bacterium]
MKKEKINEILQDIRDPDRLLEACKRYHNEVEKRGIAYAVSKYIISKEPSNYNYILASIKLILITWNAVRFQRLKKRVQIKIDDNILGAYKYCEKDLNKLKEEKLESIDLNVYGEKIKKVFKSFSEKKSIGYTGASKALHLINPELFMMRDDSITKAYHILSPNYRKRKIKHEESYLEFMEVSQRIAKELLKKTSKEEIWKKHWDSMDKEFMRAFYYKETLPKMMDEYNYVKITKADIKKTRKKK